MDLPVVKQASDNLIKGQWGRKLYKSDGLKKTLITKNFFILIIALFSVVALCLLFQGGVETGVIKSEIPFPILVSAEPERNLNIPRMRESGTSGLSGSSEKSEHRGHTSIRFSGPQLIVRKSLSQIPPGLFAKGVLLSGASNGLVRAELLGNIEFNGDVFLEAGTILVGRGMSNEERLMVNFDKIVQKDGSVDSVNIQACDLSDKIVGLKGSKLGNHALKIAGGIGLGFVGGLSEGLQDSHSENGAIVHDPSLKNAMLNGAATAALDESRDLLTSIKDKVPVIEVQEGTAICVMTQ